MGHYAKDSSIAKHAGVRQFINTRLTGGCPGPGKPRTMLLAASPAMGRSVSAMRQGQLNPKHPLPKSQKSKQFTRKKNHATPSEQEVSLTLTHSEVMGSRRHDQKTQNIRERHVLEAQTLETREISRLCSNVPLSFSRSLSVASRLTACVCVPSSAP